MAELEQIKQAIAVLEAQRSSLGDAVVDAALGPLREILRSLQPQTAEQRKQVTVLFADLAGFTAMSARLDPEDTREILNAYFKRWTASIESRHGLVEKFIGDAVMAVFGLPHALEDDPERAIRAALEMRTALLELNHMFADQYGVKLTMRVGIHTGPVVVSFLGERRGQDFVVVGDAVNLTSRLQSVAPDDGILITHDTYRHVRGLFVVHALEPFQVKGVTAPLQAYRVESARQHAFRLQIRGVEGIETLTIGREADLARLKQAYATAQTGARQFVTIVGEAGIGKSRLLDEFDNWLELLPDVVWYFKGRASPAMQYQAYSLLRDLFSNRFHIQDSDQPRMVREKVVNGFRQAYPPDPGVEDEFVLRQAHIVGQLLGYDFHDSPYLGSVTATRQLRDQALAYMQEYLLALALRNPVVLLLEDLHWADESSLDAVNRLARSLAQRNEPVRLLVVASTRPGLFERRPPWSAELPFNFRLDLQPLSRADSLRLVAEILQKVPVLPDKLTNLIVQHADGNPFYIEELIKMFIEDGIVLKDVHHWYIADARLESVRVPQTLTGVLQSRFDRLQAEERGLLQRASIIGRVFWDDAVCYVDQIDPDSSRDGLDSQLAVLNRREMIYQHDVSVFDDTREYQFKHAMMRDVTYESVLKRERRIYHSRAALWLEEVTTRSQRAEEYAAIIAEHYDQAGDAAQAWRWYRRAAQAAETQYANAEVIRLLSRALELAPAVDPAQRFEALKTREHAYDMLGARGEQRADLDAMLSLAEELEADNLLSHCHLRFADMCAATARSDEARTHAALAVSLAEKSGDLALHTRALLQLGATSWQFADYTGARPTLELALILARQTGQPNLEADALRNLGVVLEAVGEFAEARRCFEQAYAIMRNLKNRRGEGVALNSLGVMAYSQQDFPAAMQYLKQSLQIKIEIGDRRGQSNSNHNLGLVSYGLGNLLEARVYLEQSLKISREIDDIDGQSEALTSLGYVSLHLGDHERAGREMGAAVEIYQRIEDPQGLSDACAYLGLLNQRLGNLDAALQYCREADRLADEVGHWDQMAHARVFLGHCLAALGQYPKAASYYHAMIAMQNAPAESNLIHEARAGLLRLALAESSLDVARTLVDDLWAHLQSGDGAFGPLYGMDEPFRVYLSVCQALQALGDPQVSAALHRGHHLLHSRAARLPDGPARAAFLNDIPAHRQLQELYRRSGDPAASRAKGAFHAS